MEAYFSSYSSSKTSYLSQNSEEAKAKEILKHVYPYKSHKYALLHSVNKSPAKPWKKAPIAPMPPTPVKVYKVDAINFKDIVQQLTSEPGFKLSKQNVCSSSVTTSLQVPLTPKRNISSGDSTGSTSPPLPLCTANNWFLQYLKREDFGKNFQEGALTTSVAGLLEMNWFDLTNLLW